MITINRIFVAVVGLSILLGLSPFLADGLTTNTLEKKFDANATAVDMDNNTTKQIGVVTNPSLRFGKLPVGSASVKYVNITSSKMALVNIDVTGNISPMLEYDDKFYFKGEKQAKIRFNASEPGYYQGEVRLKIQTAKNRIGERWLDFKASLP